MVSAGHDLAAFDLCGSLSGSTAYASDLIYTHIQAFASVVPEGDKDAVITPHPSSPHDSRSICDGLANPEIVRRDVTDAQCRVTLATRRCRDGLIRLPLIHSGPFHVEREQPYEQTTGRASSASRKLLASMTLRNDDPDRSHIEHIEIVAMPLHEQWRQLFAHRIDVIPNITAFYRSRFDEITSVRTIELPISSNIALYFNTQRQPWSDRDLRRFVATTLDRAAIARIACTRDGCVADEWTAMAPASAVPFPDRVHMLILANDTTAVMAARAISYHLRAAHDTEVIVETSNQRAVLEKFAAGAFDLYVGPLPVHGGAALLFQIRQRLSKIAKYEDPTLSRAARAGDAAAVIERLRFDVPVWPLFKNWQFAAVDRRFCGGEPRSEHSWRWLAGLRPCQPDEVAR